MSFTLILRIQGFLLLFIGAAMCLPPVVALLYREDSWVSFLSACVVTLPTGLCLILSCPSSDKQISHREGFLVVSLGWIIAALFGCLPFLFDHTFSSFSDAYFETVSGFTTTGATVIGNIEALPRSILFWRSMIQWLGGMGIILFSIAILPLLGIGGMQLYKAEVPGPVVEKIKPRIAETARALWKVYILLSLFEVLLLIFGGMDVFDATCHTFTTMATGGFSTRNNSIEAFNSPYIETVIIIFMFAAGINFSLHYRIFHFKFKNLWQDREFIFYVSVLTSAIILLTLAVQTGTAGNYLSSFRYSAFQAVSIMTTTGFSTVNFDTWPLFAKLVLLILMFVGGCAGSTAGGIKCIRILLLFKRCYRELFYMVHPHAVVSIKINEQAVPENILRGLTGFVIFYVFIFIFGTLAMSLCGLDFMTSLSSVAASLGNIGPGFGGVGPYENFHFIPDAAKWILIVMMLLGRLEIFTLLILLFPAFWKK